MLLDVDLLIEFFKKNSTPATPTEMGEQDQASGGSSSGGSSSGGGKTMPKWADTYPLKRGKANPLTKSGEKWQTGLTRGAANQIW